MALRLDSYDEISLAAGKEVADVVLARVGKLLMSKVRVEDSVARTAPATFMVLAAATGAAQMVGLAQRLHRELAEAKVTYHDRSLKFAASFGIASLAVDAVESIEELMRAALVRLHKQQTPPIAPKPGGLPRDIEVALGVLERASRARLGPAAAELAERLSRVVKALR
jgi:diguanylate cyclase (GGDEF)-like protein